MEGFLHQELFPKHKRNKCSLFWAQKLGALKFPWYSYEFFNVNEQRLRH